MAGNLKRGQVPFPFMGEGLFVQFTMNDLAQLEDFYGAQYLEQIESLIATGSVKVVIKCLEFGLKQEREAGSCVAVPVNWDNSELGFSPNDTHHIIMDAICFGSLGKSFQDTLEEAAKMQADQEKAIAEATKGGEAADPFEGSKVSKEPKQSDTLQG